MIIQRTLRTMNPGIFVQALNPMTGKMEWKNQPEDYDYQQELARAAFADMLHDTERNKLYYEGLKSAIEIMRSRGEPVRVLDIGTGTGLLSMMAAKIGADSITAIEEFRPMANCAEKIIKENGYEKDIKLVRKRSTHVQVGPGLDMEERANILVTEVFDTELIGEGAISVFNHAHDQLLTENCLVVPNSATVFAQVVSSDVCSKWIGLHDIKVGEDKIEIPESQRGSGASSLALHDVQLSQIETIQFQALSDPLPIFEFDYGRFDEKSPTPERRQSVCEFSPKAKSKVDAIFLWWELKMDPKNKITLSCAPIWAHPERKQFQVGDKIQPWRDHWMQAIYYPISRPEMREQMVLVSNHDEYSYWFDIKSAATKIEGMVPMPDPKPGIHMAVSRTRLGQLNDESHNDTLVNAVKRTLENCQGSRILVLSEQSLLPLIVAKLAKNLQITTYEPNIQFRDFLETTAKHNGLILDIKQSVENVEHFDVILSEPSFSISYLPWHNLYFWYMLKNVQNVKIMPKKATIWCCPVTFQDLWKIRAPLKSVEGFNVKHFDDIIMDACDISDAEVEPQPLWEYPCKAECEPKSLVTFDLTRKIPENELKTTTTFENLNVAKRGSGLVFWMDWHLTDRDIVCTGPLSKIKPKQDIEWNMHHKQGVHFFIEKSEDILIKNISVDLIFESTEGNISFGITSK